VRAAGNDAEISLRAPGLTRAALEGARPQLSGLFDQAREFQVRTSGDGQEFVFGFSAHQQQGGKAA
jgi:hypothetical protein